MNRLNKVYKILDFCAAYGICEATYYNLRKRGLAPKVLLVGKSHRITYEAAKEWEKKMERAALQQLDEELKRESA